MVRKSEQLQIRLTPIEKAALKRLAREAGEDVSTYVLARAIPQARLKFGQLLELLRGSDDHRLALAELNDLLTHLAPVELREAVAVADLRSLSDLLQNYVAAMVEQACTTKRSAVPKWVQSVEPLHIPWFATELKSMRLHLLHSSPTAFKRRNLFVDSSIGDRV